jgi:hypothetical protein
MLPPDASFRTPYTPPRFGTQQKLSQKCVDAVSELFYLGLRQGGSPAVSSTSNKRGNDMIFKKSSECLTMQDRIDAIYEARRRFIDADERYQKACQTADDLTLDIRVAKRVGNDDEAAALQSRYAEHSQSVWWPAYKEWRDSAKALMAALDVDADRIGMALS